MSEQEAVGAEIAAAVDVIAALWPGLVGDPKAVAQAWLWVLGDDVRPGEIARAVKKLLREPDRAYPPRPGEVLAEVRARRQEDDPRKQAVRETVQRMLAEAAEASEGELIERETPKFLPQGVDMSGGSR
jgi:hypothetical protein